ncbi:MAG: chemotaxis protein CheW [Ignavibacteriaceae bacterium]|nr:chemotaxis protein CheW [Ignavibacteriaceae bacterium]
MLHLVFQTGEQKYAFQSSLIVEILPFVKLRKSIKTPGYFAGQLNYRGVIVPVIDLNHLLTSTPSENLLSTRIIIVNYEVSKTTKKMLGLLCEQVMEIIDINTATIQSSGFTDDEASYLGDLTVINSGMIQFIKPENLLPDYLKRRIFGGEES